MGRGSVYEPAKKTVRLGLLRVLRASVVNSSLLREGLLALHVVLLEVVAILPAAHVVQPLLIIAIPRDRVRQALIELHLRPPAQLARQLLAIDRVPQIMARAIGDELNQFLGPPQ